VSCHRLGGYTDERTTMSGKSNGSSGSGPKKPSTLTDEEIAKRLSMQYRVPTVDLGTYEVASEILTLLPRALCERHIVLPVSRAGSSLIVAMVDPSNLGAIDELKFVTGYNIEPVIATETAIRAAIARYYGAKP
jgi:type IV pilus assembly protein PilB